MFSIRSCAIIVALSVCVPGQSAASDVGTYERLKRTDNSAAALYMAAAGSAFQMANIVLIRRGDKPLYCPPGKLALSGENYIDITDRVLAKSRETKPVEDGLPIEIPLLFGLQETFPCDGG